MSTLILISIIVISICITVIYYTKKKYEYSIKVATIKDDTERLKLYSEFDFDKIDSRLDKYIDEAGMKYKLDNFEYKAPDEIYLNEEEMQKMIKKMVKDVRKKITPAVLSLIELSYNINEEVELIELLCEKIKLYVLNYSLEVNQEIEE